MNHDIETLAINTIRTLAMDAVQQANSGHPGTPMALAPTAYVLWSQFLRYDPNDPEWPVRDRFVLSCGHASMLLYSLLHLSGVRAVNDNRKILPRPSISLEDIRRFRQWHSRCAGHPEYGEAAGIETTTGPLGQGLGNSVGLAMAGRWQQAWFGRPGFDLFGFRVFALCSDGDIMEGVGCEAASLAGHLQLGNLCWIYDDNHITIEGHTDLAFSEDVDRRFQGLGWRTCVVEDANDTAALRHALQQFDSPDPRPLLIRVRSVIAWGAPNKANTHGAHGSPLGAEEIRLTKEVYGWPADASFLVPDEVKQHFADTLQARGHLAREEWSTAWDRYHAEFPTEAASYRQMIEGELPRDWSSSLPQFDATQTMATRVSSGEILNAVAARIPWFMGGSADLAPSTKTLISGEQGGPFRAGNYRGRNFHFGIREHAMAAAANGMSLAGIRPYVSTFFVFSDYLRPSLRLSALMRRPVLYIFTHDSIGLGEDGPTHQPVEQLAACRAIPGLVVIRPADANEVSEAYRLALQMRDRPVALVLTRQDVPTLDRETWAAASGLARGAYPLAQSGPGDPAVILIGTGSELHIALAAYERAAAQGINVRLVSMPSWELFEMQDAAYRLSVLPAAVTRRVAIEAGVRQGWDRYLGPSGQFVGLDSFGASAPYEELYAQFGLTVERVLAAIQ